MDKKIIAVLMVIVVVASVASIAIVSLNSGIDGKSGDEIVAGMAISQGGETFGFGDMGTYYLHGANVYHENLICMNENGEYMGLLAESWEVNEDASKWTFVLRNNVEWHDGVKFTADDVIFTIAYTLQKKPWGMNDASFLNDLKDTSDPNNLPYYKGVNSEGKETVTLEMNGPYSNLLLNMRCGLSIVPKHIYENVDDPMTYGNPSSEMNAAMGTGPFIVKKLDVAAKVMVLERNDDYYLGDVHAKKLTIRYYSDANVMAIALKRGDIDMCLAWGSGLSSTVQETLKDDEGIILKNESSAAIFGLGFNCKKAPFDDYRLRVALSFAVDYKKMNELILGNTGMTPGKSMVPHSIMYYKDNGDLFYDPVIAKTKLAELGYVDTDDDGFVNVPDGGGNWKPTVAFSVGSADIATVMEKSFKDSGIDLQLNPVSAAWGNWKRQVDENGNRLYDMVLTGCSHLGTYTYCGYGTTFVSVNGGLKDCQVDTPEFNALLSNLKSAGTDEKMKSAAENLQDWYSDNMPLIPFYDKTITIAYSSSMYGIYLDQQFGYTICHDTLMNMGYA